MMKKSEIIKYIAGKSKPQETEKVLRWIEKNDANRQYFHQLKSLWIASNLPAEQANPEDYKDLLNRMDKKSRSFRRVLQTLQRVAAILFLPLVVFSGYLLFKESTPEGPKEQYITYYANKGIKSRFELPDGTKVWLNSDSYLKCPVRFSPEIRQVFLSGEAFFDVTENEEQPFIVNTNKLLSVKVTGTSFDLSCYNDDNYIYTTLVSGSVDILINRADSDKNTVVQMAPNDYFSLYTINGEISKQKVDPYNYTSWKEGWLCFENTPLSQVIKKLSRWYGCNFIVKSPNLLNLSLTAKFSSESISQVMALVKESAKIQYEINDSVVIIY